VDILRQLRERYAGKINFLVVRGDPDNDLLPILQITDCLLNPRRFPNISRLADECKLNHIPVIENNDVETIIEKLESWEKKGCFTCL
jgi:hypothetical protein